MDLSQISATLSGVAPKKAGGAAEAVAGFADVLRDAETQAKSAVTGGADPHSLVTALAEGQLAVDTVVTIRDRVVEAYQEILRMQV